jgi:RHS repeat-associated protein
MPPGRETLLCHYHYDPLDRLVDCMPAAQATTRRFYLKDRLATEIQGVVQRSIMQHDDQLLAQQQQQQQQRQSSVVETHLLASDQQRSVLNVLAVAPPHPIAYTPYGHRRAENGFLSLLGFNGERPDPVTGCYLLGNGYRAFNPVLMRFNSPDSWSPFGDGGLNAYAYCVGDPVNRMDPTGRFPSFPSGYNPLKGFRNMLRRRTPTHRNAPLRASTTASSSHLTNASETNAPQTTKDMTIASQQETIKSQQKTIASQQKNLDSAVTTIEQGRVVVRDYQKTIAQQQEYIAQQQAKIDDLMSDLEFAIQTNPASSRDVADITAVYGPPSQQSRGIPANYNQRANTAIRRQ